MAAGRGVEGAEVTRDPPFIGRDEARRDHEARGERRYEQSGKSAAQETILKEIRERDDRDRNRAQSPLKPAPDAVVIDSTHLTLEEVVSKVEGLVTARMASQ